MRIVRFKKRVFMTLSGVFIAGVAVAMLDKASFGLDPFQTFAHGLNNLVPLSYGLFYAIINAILLVADFFLDKHYIGLATFINLFGVGYIVDGFSSLFDRLLPDPSLPVRILFFIGAFVILCFGSALYFTSDLGVSTFDALIQITADRKILPFKWAFIVLDIICVVVGALTGCLPGIGTLITALCMGPLVDWFNIHFARPFLWGINAEYTPVLPQKPETKLEIQSDDL